MAPFMRLGLGIDTGGTYTDSAITDMDTGRVLYHSKALTTHEDLVKGIVASLEGLPSVEGISLVSLSSTLATNSVVEGKSCRVGLILIGRELKNIVQTSEYGYVDGEFDLRGNIYTPLDEDAAVSILNGMKGRIDSLAVAGYLSVRYPAHENRIRELADSILDVPVICAHDLTSKLGFEQRVNTAAINAGLIPIIIDLIKAVRTSLDRKGIHAPLMMVKGDGSVMNIDTAVRRPIETILSGPASSLTSAMVHSGARDALVVDIGGTTTDIGLVLGGYIHTLDDGAVIAGKRTRVHAADVSTFGIGGDSGFFIDDEGLHLSSVRVIPICMAAHQWPSVRSEIIEDTGTFLVGSYNHNIDRLSEKERIFMSRIGDTPIKADVPDMKGCDIGMLESEGYVLRIGLTPTDILAAEGRYDTYDWEASREFISGYAKRLFMDADSFLAEAEDMVVRKMASVINEHISRIRTDKCGFYDRESSSTDDSMDIEKADLEHLPVIGIGAPAGAWMPMVCRAAGRELILPEDYDVANAVGAISSSVTEYAELAIRASPMDFSEDPECRVYAGEDSYLFKGKKQAIDFAVEKGMEIVRERAISSGGEGITVDHRIDEILRDLKGDGSRYFRGADLIFRAVGRPALK